ncbi:retrovirus-related pol polyprotein from transposon TNT 1-94, partial [Tanacetum coccineum]
VKPTTSASGSKPSGNTKNNRITRPQRSNQKNKVKDHPRKVKSSLNKTNSVFKPISNALVKHSVRNAKFESIYAICNKCLFESNHDMCLIDYVHDLNVKFLRSKDEAPDAIIKCIKNIQVHLNATIRNVRSDNGTQFVNQTLRDFYANVGISHQTSVARTSQQNGVVKR